MSYTDDKLPPEQVESTHDKMQASLLAAELDFENKLLIISTGALGLSIAFIDDIVPLVDANFRWILIAGWAFLAACLILNLFSQLYSAHAIRLAILELNADEKSRTENINRRNNVTKRLNVISASLLGLGVISLVVFASTNVPDERLESKIETSQTGIKPT